MKRIQAIMVIIICLLVISACSYKEPVQKTEDNKNIEESNKDDEANTANQIDAEEPSEENNLIEGDSTYTDSTEGVVYVEEQIVQDGETYVVFSFESEPNVYYFGKVAELNIDMTDNNYYFNIVYNEGDLIDGRQYCEIINWDEYSYNIVYESDTSIVGQEDTFTPQIKEEYDSAFYSEETGIWVVGNTTINGKPFKLDGIEYLYIEDGYLYFMGRIANTSSKDYKILLNVTIRDKNGNVLNDVLENNFVFNYDTTLGLIRDSSGDSLQADGLKLQYPIPGGSIGYFTSCQAFYSSKIEDRIDIRRWNSEPYYIYVTIKDYMDN